GGGPGGEGGEGVEGGAGREGGEAAAHERAEKVLARAREIGLERAAAEVGATVDTPGPFERRGSIPKLVATADLHTDALVLTPEAPLAPKVYASAGDAVAVALRERGPAD